VAKKKVVNTNLDQNLNGTNFTHTTSETIFQFGSFALTSNFSGRLPIDYANTLSTFVRPVTLETLGVNDIQSAVLHEKTTNAVLNLDKSNLNTFIRFGSAYEFLRVSVQEIILAYPASLFISSKVNPLGNLTLYDFTYDVVNNTSTFKVPLEFTVNKFGLAYNQGNQSKPDNMEIKNLNLSYDKYAIWSKYLPDLSFPVIGFTGYTVGGPQPIHSTVKVLGYPFPFVSGLTTTRVGYFDFHIRPNNVVFEEFRTVISGYEQYMMSQRDGLNGFIFNINDPTLLDDGSVTYSNSEMLWNTTDGYNIDISTGAYQRFLEILLTIGAKYDQIKTDLIARFLTPASIKTYDLTQDGKMIKLLRIYGWEFDRLREFIDSLVYINTVTYNKVNNIPDQLIQNLARTFGWDYFNLVNEAELVNNVLSVDTAERNLNTDLLPAEVNIELWRRILINTNYFWKSKGTRQAIKAMFLMIGIPEPFINITEYVYTVDGKINPNTVQLTQADFPSNSLPYDASGYPVAPTETNSFYFQVSGDTDAGQTYMNAFRMAGFDLMLTVDNRKSWIQTGATTRIDDSTPQYYQQDSKLVLNTKEVDVALDTARGIEYDVYTYIQEDYKINNSGYTMPFSYVNISLGLTGATQSTFRLPAQYDKQQGDLEVRLNGILLNAPKVYTGGTDAYADYSVNPINNSFTLNETVRSDRDVIQATFIYSGATAKPVTGITVQYVVTRIKPNLIGTTIPLPSFPRGDVQVTINGIALTKGTPQFTADYIVNPANSISGTSSIILQNPDIIGYLAVSPFVQVAYVEVVGSNDINARSEVVRVDSFNSSKIYYNVGASKYVYRLNYKVNNARDVKFLIDGIALNPPDINGNRGDYSINSLDPFEVFLPNGIRYGTVISAYYLIGGNALFTPLVSDEFGLGDISNLSFLEFIDLIQRKMINARNRKTVSDFKGGWYPALLRLYELYLLRGLLPPNDPLHSNGYTFANLYPFLSKYNAFFQKFVDQLLSATIILRGGGLLIRNTVFTKQKFMYKRGVNLFANGVIGTIDMRGNPMLQYRGDDGSQFWIAQDNAPPPLILHVDTCSGFVGTCGSPSLGYINSGGFLISGYTNITEYGMQYKKNSNLTWCISPSPLISGPPSVNHYASSICNLDEGTCYDFRAIVQENATPAYGDTISVTIPITPPVPPVLIPSGLTKAFASSTSTSFVDAGGCCIQGYQCIEWYGMQYRCVGTVDISVSPSTYTNIPSAGAVDPVTVFGPSWNNTTVSTDSPSWITISTPVAPSTLGTINNVTIISNGGSARMGTVCYTPVNGSTKCVLFSQCAYAPASKTVQILCEPGGCGTNYCDPIVEHYGGMTVNGMVAGESFYPTFRWCLHKPVTSYSPTYSQCVVLLKNGSPIYQCCIQAKGICNCGGYGLEWSTSFNYGDCIQVVTCATAQDVCGGQANPSYATIYLSSVVNGVGSFSVGPSTFDGSTTCSNMVVPIF
jgi:hypothetical protein